MFNVRNILLAGQKKNSFERDRHFQGKILLCGASSIAGSHNFGDDLYTAIYVEWLQCLCPNAELSMLRYKSFPGSTSAWDSQFEQADALFFMGGGYFGEPDYPGMNIFRRRLRQLHWAIRNYRLYGGAFHAAQRHRVPHGVIGVEFGPIRSGFFRRCAVRLLQEARVCALRNPESADYARKYGVRRKDIGVYVDAVLSLKPEHLPQTAIRVRDAHIANPDTFRIGLNLNSLSVAHWERAPTIVRLIQNLRSIAPPGKRVSLFFLHDQQVNGQHPKARLSAEFFLKKHFPDLVVLPFQGHWEMVGTLAAMNVVVTTKLHVGVTSRALSVPVLSLPGHHKTARFYRFIGEQEFCIPVDNLLNHEVPRSLRDLFGNWYPEKCYPVANKARESAEQNKRMLEAFISELQLNRRRMAA